jgi:hypothetical protein
MFGRKEFVPHAVAAALEQNPEGTLLVGTTCQKVLIYCVLLISCPAGAAAAVRSLHSVLVLVVATALLHMLLTRAYCACSAAVENLRISGSMSLFSKDAAKGAK